MLSGLHPHRMSRRIMLLRTLLLISLSAPLPAAFGQQSDEPSGQPEKLLGHWGEDAIGFRWTEQDSVDGRWQATEVGPFLSTTVNLGSRAVLSDVCQVSRVCMTQSIFFTKITRALAPPSQPSGMFLGCSSAMAWRICVITAGSLQ